MSKTPRYQDWTNPKGARATKTASDLRKLKDLQQAELRRTVGKAAGQPGGGILAAIGRLILG